MFNTNINKVLRSVLIAGDSNLKQLVPMFEYPVRTLCIPGAKVQNDRKEFYSQLMSAMKTENPDQIVLHLGSNDVFGDVESTLRSYRFLIENLLLKFKSLQIGICGILPRAVNHYESSYWNLSALPRLQRDVEKLNAGIQSLTCGYSRCFFIDYAQLFKPAVHLGRDGLHVNRNGAFILKMTIENYLAERQKCVTSVTAILSHVQVPDVESLSPKMTYAEVVRLPVPSSDTGKRPFDTDAEHQNSSRTPSKRKRLSSAGARRSNNKRSHRKPRGTYKTGYSLKRNEIVLDVTEDLAVILSSSVIHSFYQTDTKKQSVESLQVKQSKKTAVTKKEKKSTYNCPVCPVICSREDFLIDHVICCHAKKGKTHLVKDLSLQVPITEEPVEELRSSYDENDKHIAYGSVYIEGYEVDCIIPSQTEFAESDEVECSILTTIEFAESDELECSISTIEFAESDEVECSIPTTIDFAESEEVESSSPTRIEFALTTVKVLASRCWKNFKRFILHLCGDVEENPGPTMLKCKWEQCTEDKFTDIRLLAQHVISHIHPGILCQWEECVYCCPNEQYKLEIHVLQHIYLEQLTFQSIEEWGRALPSGQFSENCTDLHLCPPNLKIKLGLPLLDEEFSMPSQYPYTVKDHQLYVLQLQTENPENYERLVSAFQQKVETMSDTTASQSGTEPSTSTSGNTTELTIQGIDQLAVLNSNMTRSSQQVIVTNRPELTGTNQSTVKFTLRDETEIVTRKYISSNSKKRKYVASSIQNLNDRNMTENDLITNLNMCRQAILVEHNIISKMQDMKFLDPNNCLFLFEEAAINMSTYPDCSEGVFIFSIFDIEIENHNAPVHYIRYIESGYYKHFMEETFLDVICQTLGILQDNVFLCNILTGGDQQRMLIEKKNKDSRKSRTRPDKIYANNLKSLKSRRQQLCEKVKDFCDIELAACFVHTARHGYKVKIDSDASDGLYFSSNNELFHTDIIQNKILHYPEVKNAEVSDKCSDDFMKPLPASNVNNLCYKSCMINFLSNDHNRFLGKENLRYHYRFSTSPKATSLRNRVLYLYKNHQLNELQTIYSSFQQEDQNQENINNQNMNDPTGEPQTKRTRTFIPRKKILTKEMALQTISGQNVENMFKKVNLYDNYKKNLLQNRSFIIQVYDEEKVIAIMNDYDDESGEFRSSDYVKTSRDLFENGYFYTCNCRIYRTLLESLDNNMEQFDALDENGIKCMHCRFLHQEVSPNLERNEQATVTNIQVVIQDALLYKDRKIIELPTTRPGTKKFSILIDDDISLVHLTFNSRLQRYIVSCLNGLCKSKKGCKKNVDCLNTDQNLCVHLSELKNAPHFWTEFSKPEAAVNTENDENIQLIDPNLVQNIQHRYILGALNLNNVENGCIKGPHLIPDIPTSVCPCGAGWTSNQQLNGVSTFSRVLTIYTKIAPVQCQVYSRSCANEESPCKKDWDEGDKECLHVVTRDTAAGDEIDHISGLNINAAGNGFYNRKMYEMREYAPELRDLIASSMLSHANPQGNNFVPDDVITFIRYLIKCVADMEITQPDPANPQPGTYNPAKYGRAYYFSETDP
ncbi:uncharacterized protein LOC127702847 [Mytilus californianus]|uniref:uncharacterized protein LOC127702847 n=1 Tax=Mytilus californianus TaxID=6549 RepID=UPI002245DE34|nr:uncharacterized protein LOC127702847 [Mytilus californianus]